MTNNAANEPANKPAAATLIPHVLQDYADLLATKKLLKKPFAEKPGVYPLTCAPQQSRGLTPDSLTPDSLKTANPGSALGFSAKLLPNQQPITRLSYDSRNVQPGTLFICKGAHFSPEFLAVAIQKGAVAYISEVAYSGQELGIDPEAMVPVLLVNNIRDALTSTAALYYGGLTDRLALLGITGTKGKSTTTYYLRHILDAYLAAEGRPQSAVLSSIDNYDGIINEESHLTTQETLELYEHFAHAVASQIDYLTMEVSSQGLKYGRTDGIIFDVSCFLNIGNDHISAIEHSDFDDYFNAKLKIFAQSKTACINLQTEHLQQVLDAAAQCERLLTFGTTPEADVYGYDIVTVLEGISFRARTANFDQSFQLGMTGLFNVQNALAAIAVASSLDIPVAAIQQGLLAARVGGRMELFQGPDGKLAIIDYAHNKMSFAALFDSTREQYPSSSLSIVFGCPGYKAYDRRSDLGSIAGRYADLTIVTEEDAGEEPVIDICRDIANHVQQAGGEVRIIEDRELAIITALDSAPVGAVILLTGKGRETRQKRGREYVPVVSDVDIVCRHWGL